MLKGFDLTGSMEPVGQWLFPRLRPEPLSCADHQYSMSPFILDGMFEDEVQPPRTCAEAMLTAGPSLCKILSDARPLVIFVSDEPFPCDRERAERLALQHARQDELDRAIL